VLDVLASLVSVFFGSVVVDSFFGYSLLVIAVISTIGLIVAVLRRLMMR